MDYFRRKHKEKPVPKQVEEKERPAIMEIGPYKSAVALWMFDAFVVFYVPGEDVQEVTQDPNYMEMAQSRYIIDSIRRTKFYGYSNDAWLEEFRFYVSHDDWCEFESQPYVLALKKHLLSLQSRYRSSVRHEAIDSQGNAQNETPSP